MQHTDPATIYGEIIKDLRVTGKKLQSRKSNFAWLRFFSLVLSIVALWQLVPINLPIAFIAFILLFGAFLWIVVLDLRNKEALNNNNLLITINNEELAAFAHDLSSFPDGERLKPDSHPYANDLDIFGKASLYQFVNRTVSEQGNQKMAAWLLSPAPPPTIARRQVSVKELSSGITWTQQLRAYGTDHPLTADAEKRISQWISEKNNFRNALPWKIIQYLLPVLALTNLALLVFNVIGFSTFTPITLLFFFAAYGISRVTRTAYIQLNKIVGQLESFQNSLHWIEESSFKTELLLQIKKEVTDGSNSASRSIRQLKKILERFDYRYNPIVHVPLNTFLLWDLQQVMQLEAWRSRHTQTISLWLNALAEMEALSSLATLSFNYPGWTFPTISNGTGVFAATDLGHPLIPREKRVNNTFTTEGAGQINLVTGSNMAGKSTFLRSIGVNLVLAMTGGPACATHLTVSPMNVISSMRVNDNLEENTSTFYAELKKLKEIIEAVNRREKVFLLLDEILRGTNSADRHTGSIALIRQLIREDASGLVATHDLELAKLAAEFPNGLHNYHFDVQVKNEELYFDYRLKNGVCSSMNASLLMKKIGIEL